MKKSFVLAACIVICTALCMIGAEKAFGEYYDDNTGDDWDNAYIISSSADLMLMRDRVNYGRDPAGKYYKLNADIDLTSLRRWVGIGYNRRFMGYFDGQSHTISLDIDGSEVYDGLFRAVDNDAVIRNLKVTGSVKGKCSGTIVHYLEGGTVDNCSFNGTVIVTGDSYGAGGIIAHQSGGTVINCRVNAVISADNYAGGIVWELNSGDIKDCIVEDGTTITGQHAGGIAGVMYGGRVTNCSWPESYSQIGSISYTDTESLSLSLTPSSQTVTAGDPITAIDVSAYNIFGTLSWSFAVSGDYSLGLASRDTSITGTIPSDTTPDTYTITVTAYDYRDDPVTEAVAIQVEGTAPLSGNSTPYRFTMLPSLQNSILSAFPGLSASDIHQLTDSEIIADEWTIDIDDAEALVLQNENTVLNIPAIRAQNTGVYVLRLVLENAEAGAEIMLHGVSGSGPVSVSELQDMNYTFFDENGNIITAVPDSKVVYAAMQLTAGTETHGVITVPSIVAFGTVQPVEPESYDILRRRIAEVINIPSSDLKFIAEENIFPAPDPAQELMDTAREDNYSIIGKLNTLSVDIEGYYVFRVELSDELFEQIDGVSADQLAIYTLSADTESEVSSVFLLNGLASTWELLTLGGQRMEFGIKEFLMVGFLNAGKPLTIYLAKLVLALLGLPVGCSLSGLGFAGASGFLTAMIFIVLRKRH